MISLFSDASVIKNYDLIRIAYRLQPVSDYDNSFIFDQGRYGLLDQDLILRIQR